MSLFGGNPKKQILAVVSNSILRFLFDDPIYGVKHSHNGSFVNYLS